MDLKNVMFAVCIIFHMISSHFRWDSTDQNRTHHRKSILRWRIRIHRIVYDLFMREKRENSDEFVVVLSHTNRGIREMRTKTDRGGREKEKRNSPNYNNNNVQNGYKNCEQVTKPVMNLS